MRSGLRYAKGIPVCHSFHVHRLGADWSLSSDESQLFSVLYSKQTAPQHRGCWSLQAPCWPNITIMAAGMADMDMEALVARERIMAMVTAAAGATRGTNSSDGQPQLHKMYVPVHARLRSWEIKSVLLHLCSIATHVSRIIPMA